MLCRTSVPELRSPTRMTCSVGVERAQCDQLLRLRLADRVGSPNASRCVLTKRNWSRYRSSPSMTVPSTESQPRLTGSWTTPGDHGRELARVVGPGRVAEGHLAVLPGEDHVAHRQTRVEVGPEQRDCRCCRSASTSAGSSAVELLLDLDDLVVGVDRLPAPAYSSARKSCSTVSRRLSRKARQGKRGRAAVGGHLLPPQSHLLESDQVRLRSLDLPREGNGTLREVRALELVPDHARAVDRRRDVVGRERARDRGPLRGRRCGSSR